MLRKILTLLGAVVALVLVLALAAFWLIDPNDYRDEIGERASAQLGREVQLAGPMSLKLFPWLAIETSDVGVGNPADFGESPPLARIGQATASLRVWPLLRGELEIGAVTLEDADLHLVSNRAGRSNLDGLFDEDPERPASEPDLSGLVLGELRLRNVRLINLDQATGAQTVMLIERLDLDPFRADQAVPFRLTGRLSDNEQELARIESLTGNIQVASNLSAVDFSRLVGEFRLADGAARASLRAGLNLDMSREPMVARLPVLDLTLAADANRIAVRAIEPMVLTLSEPMRLDIAAAELSLNEQALSARGQLNLGDPIRAELTLSGEQLDLRPFMVADERRPAAEPGPPAESANLAGLDLRLALNLNRLLLSDGLRLDEVVARARLADEQLVLEPLEARLLGGQFNGRVSVDFSQDPPQVRLQPRLSGVRVEQMVALTGVAAPLQGLGDIEFDLSFSGLTPAAILASLDGSGSYQVADGALMGVDLRRLVSEGLSASSLGNISRSFGGQTEFNSFGGTMVARAGVIELPDLNLAAADFGVRGSGQLSLAAGQLDYRMQLALGEALMAQLPRRLRDATGGTIPLSISGPIAEPVVSVDVANLAERALRRELEQRLLPPRERPAEPDQPVDAQAEAGEESETEAKEPERRERSRDLLLRGLRDRRERDREEQGPAQAEEEAEAEPPPG